jgi:hypothetical protein
MRRTNPHGRSPSARLVALLATLGALAGPAPARAGAAGPYDAFLVAAGPGGRPSREAVQARLGEPVDLWVVVQEGRGSRAVWYTDAPDLAPDLSIGRRRVPAHQLRPFAALGRTEVRWSRVEPLQHHVALPPPNEGNPAYSNAVLFGPRHGRWLGYDTIEYAQTALPEAAGPHLVVRAATPADARRARHTGGLGTMRYAAGVTLLDRDGPDGALTVTTPDATSVERAGVRPDVLRVSFRSGDDLVGWLTSYFNVPNVFASAGHGDRHQTERYQGADCADVIVGAARRAGARLDYTSAAGLGRYAPAVTGLLWIDAETRQLLRADGPEAGAPVTLAFGEQVRPGDIVLIDYVGFTASSRSWDHVGVLTADRGQRGVLDPEDTLLHIGYLGGLVEQPLAAEAPAVIRILRFGPAVERAIERQRRHLAR